jgi:hypothetical protein
MKIVKAGFSDVREAQSATFGERKVSVNSGWFRGESARFRPPKAALLSPEALKEAILDGWVGDSPIIDRGTKILAFGSCFAANIARHLGDAGFNLIGADEKEKDEQNESIWTVACNEGIVNTFTIRQLTEWIYNNKAPKQPLWKEKQSKQLYAFSEPHRLRTRKLFDTAEVFIITLGLSEVWYDKSNGEVFSASIPRKVFDEQKYGFRLSTVSENVENLTTTYGLIRKHSPNARILFTLSPVPLLATFRPISCISANTVSKATLRVAVDELCRNNHFDERLHYWPSYELVMEGFRDSFANDNRHVRKEVLAFIMLLFEQLYCANGPSDENVLKAFFDAAVASGEVREKLSLAIAGSEGVSDLLALAQKVAKRCPEEAILFLRRLQLNQPSNSDIPKSIDNLRARLRQSEEAAAIARRERREARRPQH